MNTSPTWLRREWGEEDRLVITVLDELYERVLRAKIAAPPGFLAKRHIPKRVTVSALAAQIGASAEDQARYERAAKHLLGVVKHGARALCEFCHKRPVARTEDKTCSGRCGRLLRTSRIVDRNNPLSVWLFDWICRRIPGDAPMETFSKRAGRDRESIRGLLDGSTRYPRHDVLMGVSRAMSTPLRDLKAMLPSHQTHEEHSGQWMSSLKGTPEKEAMNKQLSATRRMLFKDPAFRDRQRQLVGLSPYRIQVSSDALKRHWASPRKRKAHIAKLLATTTTEKYRIEKAYRQAAEGTRKLSTSRFEATTERQSAKFRKPPEEIRPVGKQAAKRFKIALVGGRLPDCELFRRIADMRRLEGKRFRQIAEEVGGDEGHLRVFCHRHRKTCGGCRIYETSLSPIQRAPAPATYYCADCDRTFTTQRGYEMHIRQARAHGGQQLERSKPPNRI